MSREAAAGSHAESERVMIRLLRSNGIRGWEANVAIHDGGRTIGVGDIVFADRYLVVEIDGQAWHSTPDRFQRDRERQNELVNAGWTVLRFTWNDLTLHPETVVAAIARALMR